MASEPWTNFGTFKLKGGAEAELKQLHMQENHQAMKYFIKFQWLATHIKWCDEVHVSATNGVMGVTKFMQEQQDMWH